MFQWWLLCGEEGEGLRFGAGLGVRVWVCGFRCMVLGWVFRVLGFRVLGF